jgi:hypothetical protein
MLADDVACNARNKFAGSVYAEAGRHLDLYGENIEVDYRGYEVTVENFIRLLTGMNGPVLIGGHLKCCRSGGSLYATVEKTSNRRPLKHIRLHDWAWRKRVPQISRPRGNKCI